MICIRSHISSDLIKWTEPKKYEGSYVTAKIVGKNGLANHKEKLSLETFFDDDTFTEDHRARPSQYIAFLYISILYKIF